MSDRKYLESSPQVAEAIANLFAENVAEHLFHMSAAGPEAIALVADKLLKMAAAKTTEMGTRFHDCPQKEWEQLVRGRDFCDSLAAWLSNWSVNQKQGRG